MDVETPKLAFPWLMLVSRSLLFLFSQGLMAVVLTILETPDAWYGSSRWWLFMIIAANSVSIFLLVQVFKTEGKRYIDILRLS